MTEKQNSNLEDSRNWNLNNPTKSGPVRNRRTVVSVSFPSRDFQVVAAAADEVGITTSQFIREAAIAKASPVYAEVVVSWAGGTPQLLKSPGSSYSTLIQTSIEAFQHTADEEGRVYFCTAS